MLPLILFGLVFFVYRSGMHWQKILAGSGVLVGIALGTLYKYQNKILYQPNPMSQFKRPDDNPGGYRNPAEHNLQYENMHFHTSDNVRLHAWFIRAPSHSSSAATVLFFPANAGNMGFRLPNLVAMVRNHNINVMILSYRGYGESEGEPSEAGLEKDAEAAWEQLRSLDIDKDNIFVFGRSLGGAVAINFSEKHSGELRGTICENTFTSIPDIVDAIFPFFVSYLKGLILRLEWRSIDRIGHIKHPILFLCGEQDEVVPHDHMLRLYEACNSAKTIVKIKAGQHNDTWLRGGSIYRNAIQTFIDNANRGNL